MARLVALFALTLATAYECIHDKLLRESPKLHRQLTGGEQNYHEGGRRLQSTTYEPVRIKPLFVNIEKDSIMAANADRVSFLRNKLVPATIARWSGMLSTIPITGPLYAHRECSAHYRSVVPHLCAEFEARTECANTPDDEPIFFAPSELGRDFNYTFTGGQYVQVEQRGGEGILGADFGMFITAKQTPRCGSDGTGVLAYAITCQRDQFDRPTFGRVNFCPGNLDAAEAVWKPQFGVALHEFAHALGFASTSWPLFRNADAERTPRTPRDPGFPSMVAPAYQTVYLCEGFDYLNQRPSENTVAYISERGMSCAAPNFIPPLQRATGDCVHKAVGTHVKAVARAFFACDDLEGVELENQLTSDCDVMGSHWEQRILNTELMASYTQHVMLISALTLAMLEDSGWYVANYSAADPWKASSDWGFRQGCSFAKGKCINPETGVSTGNPPHFSSVNTGACTTDRRAVGYASVKDYTSALPAQYQYYPGKPTTGGDNTLVTMDFCPAIVAYSNRVCSNTQHGAAYINKRNYGETFGDASACFETSLVRQGMSQINPYGAGCFTHKCNSPTSLTVSVVGTSGASDVACGAGDTGMERTVPNFDGALRCPDVAVVCSDAVYKLDPEATPPPLPRPSASGTPPAKRPSPSASPAPEQIAVILMFDLPGVSAAALANVTAGSAGSRLRDALVSNIATAIMVPPSALFVRTVRDSRTTYTYGWASGALASQAVLITTEPTRPSSSSSRGGAVSAPLAVISLKGSAEGHARSAATSAPEGVAHSVSRGLQTTPVGTASIGVAYRVALTEPSPDPSLGSTGSAAGTQQMEDRTRLALGRLTSAMSPNATSGLYSLAGLAFNGTVDALCDLAYGVDKDGGSAECSALAARATVNPSESGVITVAREAAPPPAGTTGISSGAAALVGMVLYIAIGVGALMLCAIGVGVYCCCCRQKAEDKPVTAHAPHGGQHGGQYGGQQHSAGADVFYGVAPVGPGAYAAYAPQQQQQGGHGQPVGLQMRMQPRVLR